MSYRGSVSVILFHKPGFDLEDAFQALAACRGLDVRRNTDDLYRLDVLRPGGSYLTISFQHGAETQQWLSRLWGSTEQTEALNRCDSCFLIHIENLREVLKDSRELVMIQSVLLQATQGCQYCLWKDELHSVSESARRLTNLDEPY